MSKGSGLRRRAAGVGAAATVALLAPSMAWASPVWQTSSQSLGDAEGSVHSVTDGASRTFAAWSAAADGTLRVSMHAPGAGGWSVPLTPCGDGATEPILVGEPTGALLICERRGTTSSVVYREGSGWGSPRTLPGVGLPTANVVEADGSIVLGWLADSVRLATVGADGAPLGAITAISGTTGRPSLARARSGETVVAAAGPGQSIVVARRPGGSAAWSDPAKLGSPTTPQGTFQASDVADVSVDDHGTLTVLYTVLAGSDFRNASNLQVVSRPVGETWGTPVPLADYGSHGRLLSGSDGDLTAVWVDNYGNGADYGLTVATRPAGEPWTTPLPLSTNGSAFIAWDADANAAGDVAVAWQESSYDAGSQTYVATDRVATSRHGFVSESLGAGTAPRVTVGDGSTTVILGAPLGHRYYESTAAYAVQQAAGAIGWSWTPLREMAGNPDDPSTWPAANEVSTDAAGDVIAYWQNGPALWASTYDAAGPSLSVSVPGTATAGATVTMSAIASDAWQATNVTGWQFGDGATGEGTHVQHAYAAAGTYTVTVTAEDSLGNASGVTRTVEVGPALPVAQPPGSGAGTPTPGTPTPGTPTPGTPTPGTPTPGTSVGSVPAAPDPGPAPGDGATTPSPLRTPTATSKAFGISVAAAMSRQALFSRGVRVMASCPSACLVRVRVRVGGRLLATVTSRRRSFVVRLPKRARRALSGRTSLRLTFAIMRADRTTNIRRTVRIRS